MNLVLIRDGIKLKMPIELDPANDPADEASDLQEIAERFGFDTYDLEDAAPVQQAKTTSGMNSFERQEFLYRQSQDFKKSQGGNGW